MLASQAAQLLGVSSQAVEEAITALALDGGAQVETLVAEEDAEAGTVSYTFAPLGAVKLYQSTPPSPE